MKIKFKVFFDKKTGNGLGCRFPDGAVFLVRKDGVLIMFPKNKKFITLFKKQLNDEKRDNIGIAFSKAEILMMQRGLNYKRVVGGRK